MELTSTGDLVKVATKGPQLDGIVFHAPSSAKVVVAIMDRARGPVLRTVARDALSERTDPGPDDEQLQLLIRRSSATSGGAARVAAAAGPPRAGHRSASMHRTTGK